MILTDFIPFRGQHCETVATGSLLKQLGIGLSEPMLFGLGEGLGFIFWNMKNMDFPFIGGRIKPGALTANLASRLNLDLEVRETSSVRKAWQNVKDQIDSGTAVGLKLDSYHLEYFTSRIHFAGHYVAMYGYDDRKAYLVDTVQQGPETTTSLDSLRLARSEKGPMASKNLSYTLRNGSGKYALKKEIADAIRRNAKDFLNPPIGNFGYKGILKTSREIGKWYAQSRDVKGEFGTSARLMEKGGTGGSLFRNLYRDFLRESYGLLKSERLGEGYKMFSDIALLWKEVAGLFEQVAATNDPRHIRDAAGILVEISRREKAAMEMLGEITI